MVSFHYVLNWKHEVHLFHFGFAYFRIGYEDPDWQPLENFLETGGTFFIDKYEAWKHAENTKFAERMQNEMLRLKSIEEVLERKRRQLQNAAVNLLKIRTEIEGIICHIFQCFYLTFL